jgi:DNA polymerase III subunit beta
MTTFSTDTLDFTTDYATLADALKTVGLAVSARPPAPILGGVMLRVEEGALVVGATNYETNIAVRVSGTARGGGAVVVPYEEFAKVLAALTKGMPKRAWATLPVTVCTTEDGVATVEVGDYTMPITTLELEDYPIFPEAPITAVQVERESWASAMARTLVAVDKGGDLGLSGIALEFEPGKVSLVATDRYQMALAPVEAAIQTVQEGRTLLPGRQLTAVTKRFADEQVQLGYDPVDSTILSLTCGDITVVVHTEAGENFPSYRHLLPSTTSGRVCVDRRALGTDVQRMAALTAAKDRWAKAIALTFAPDAVTVTPNIVEHADRVKAPSLKASVVGIDEPRRFLVNPDYLMAAFGNFTSNTVVLHVTENVERPIVVTEDSGGLTDPQAFRHIIMPLRQG